MTNGDKFKQARLSAGLTQQNISDWLNIPLRTLQGWETNKRQPTDWVTPLLVDKINNEGAQYRASIGK